jgi:hypothetical protein
MEDFNNYKFRSSQIYRLLTQPRTKKDTEKAIRDSYLDNYEDVVLVD